MDYGVSVEFIVFMLKIIIADCLTKGAIWRACGLNGRCPHVPGTRRELLR
jgi:hypothetical protein